MDKGNDWSKTWQKNESGKSMIHGIYYMTQFN